VLVALRLAKSASVGKIYGFALAALPRSVLETTNE